jgi:hypothetical protein
MAAVLDRDEHGKLIRKAGVMGVVLVSGEILCLRDNPLAAYFIHRQRLYMPAYRDFVSDAELDALMRYVRWVNSGVWQQQALALGK